MAVAAVECVDEAEAPYHVSVPTLQKSRMQFDWEKFQQSLKTLQFQRSQFKVLNSVGGIACEIGYGFRNVGSRGRVRGAGSQ